jgi:hypothetical protein
MEEINDTVQAYLAAVDKRLPGLATGVYGYGSQCWTTGVPR